ncbi:fungal-specific transcription factor domain-containing protein [Aspergillus caelatus]|uniref:Fungal-specific transcription factor domain-containing protein n=1 Tax=Aspergillus caelatus TaxID=61420 RepID=A0A5N7A2M0_9EURO|nr:fungal-specific transcription factor domain-containing protein [Aspergillus caelatus]KAE8362720.1 fungal-specific transcription factor domain-containing protein [Aspergillus caelatus]
MTSFKGLKKKTLNRRTQSLGACKTCRRRHVKCDQTRPLCKTCRLADVTCDGFGSAIQWIGCSEKMSSELVSGLASQSIDHNLAEIDTQSRDLEEHPDGEISIGPFAVLNLVGDSEPLASNKDLETRLPIESAVEEDPPVTGSAPFAELSVGEDVLGSLDNYLQWEDIFNLDPGPERWMLTPPPSGYGVSSTNLMSPTRPHIPLHGTQDPSPRHELPMLRCTMGSPDILSEARLLLSHFHEHVVAQIVWVPMTQKSIWTILHIPSAMITLDQLTYMKQFAIKHANLANLYAILACASYHLGMNPHYAPGKQGEYWEHLTMVAYGEAQAHMNKSLELEFQGPQKAKYKEQLMAALGLATYSILSQNHKGTRCHLINMEYLIRLRGLVKPKLSRRARLLHYQYTWIRILTESTLVIHNQITHSAPCLDDFLRVVPTDGDSDLNIDDPKDSQTILGDIHLVDSRNFPEELHTAVNGVSETWLGLLSQTTRLANVMGQLHSGTCTMSAEKHLALHRRSHYLENMICSFTSRKPAPRSLGEPKAHMWQALNSALAIYFYRRVRQLNPCILQGYVSQIIEELHKWDAALAQHELVGPGTAWPAFMAGCEAMGHAEREAIVQWLEKARERSGFVSYTTARQIMEEVWKRREQGLKCARPALPGGPMSFSWMDYSRQNLQWLLLF